ncbi:MAG: hypothetical protein LBD05_02290 [Mycoplasmataceae bacterium]|nr:hypothetical protein [Mycoplasmataceae bacterium]
MNVNKLDKIKNKKNIQLVLIIVSIILAAFIVQFTFLITMYKPVASGEISLKLIDYMILFSLYVIPIFIAIVFIVILRRLNFFKCTKKNLLNSLKSGIVFIIGTLIIFLLQFFFENGKIINQAILIVLLFSLVATFFLQITVNFFVLDLLTEKYNIVNNQIYFTIIITSIVYAIFHTFGFTINYEIIIKKNTDFLENNLPFLLINIIGNFCTGFYSCVIFLRTRNIYSTIFYTTIWYAVSITINYVTIGDTEMINYVASILNNLFINITFLGFAIYIYEGIEIIDLQRYYNKRVKGVKNA